MFIKKMNKAVILLALLSISAFAQDTFTDSRDGKKYKSVKIGKQTWMAQNLDYHGEDGKLGKCDGNEPENCEKSGRLYDWSTAMNIDAKFNKEKWGGSAVKHQGICPKGWHLPDTTEWQTLVDFAGGTKVAVEKLKAKSGWDKCGNGTDEYGFSALPGGNGCGHTEYKALALEGAWWSTSESTSRTADIQFMNHKDYNRGLERINHNKSYSLSVRCIKD
ncbi:MAG: fibrobacter succinogenes major paralogous domain-containing protein [Candidatus Fibromonas sp.]|jgi:uncharacterized protein (TIGR02145 family)|nr:fibrobacter succinogenes major paralogous domain-containing protein [Candidatus Fibromonas sp.]